MKPPVKMLVTDIDGTLVGADGEVSSTNRDAIAAATAQGVRVVLSTGRVLTAAQPFLTDLALDGYHILCDGALVRHPRTGHNLVISPLAPDLLAEAVSFCRARGLFLEFFSATDYFVEVVTDYLRLRRFFGLEYRLVDFDKFPQAAEIIKGGLIRDSATADAVNEFVTHFAPRFGFSYAGTPAFPGIEFVNVVAKGVSKGSALRTLAAHLKVPLDAVCAVGDAGNDLPVFEVSGVSVAMGNATPEVRRMADHVTAPVTEDGLAQAIRRYVLGP